MVEHGLEPCETPSNSTSNQAPNYAYAMFLNFAKYFKTVRCGGGAVAFNFSNYLKPVLYITMSL